MTFNQSLIILTSNIGVDKIDQMGSAIGFGGSKEEIDDKVKNRETRKALEKIFPPEFLNRIDEVVLFRALDITSVLVVPCLLVRHNQTACSMIHPVQMQQGLRINSFVLKHRWVSSPPLRVLWVRAHLRQTVRRILRHV